MGGGGEGGAYTGCQNTSRETLGDTYSIGAQIVNCYYVGKA